MRDDTEARAYPDTGPVSRTLVRFALAENMVLAVASAATVLGLYAMGAGAWAGTGFLFLVFVNTAVRPR